MSLKKFHDAKLKEIAFLEEYFATENAHKDASLSPPIQRVSFSKTLRKNTQLIDGKKLAIITEYKRASPSQGLICDTLEVEEVAIEYAQNGASALSILTEKDYFQGDLTYINRADKALHSIGKAHHSIDKAVPILRKDFIFHPLQVRETINTNASAILLIVKLTPDVDELRALRELAEEHNIEAVVEIFSEEELHVARESGAKIIQVNARDLTTFKTDLSHALSIREKNTPKENETWILASGISSHENLIQAVNAGYHAVLVGTSLMKGGKPGEALSRLLYR